MGIGSSIASAIQQRRAAEEQRKKQNIIEEQNAENTALFNKQYYQDLTKRTEVQNMLRMLDEKQKKADTAVAARAAVTGATPEQQLAGREINRRTYADAVADIASNASQLRDSYLRDYQNNRNKYFAQRLGMQDVLSGIHANTANQWANAAVNGFQGGAQMLGAGLDQIGGVKAQAPAANPVLKDKANLAVAQLTHPVDEFTQATANKAVDFLNNFDQLSLLPK